MAQLIIPEDYLSQRKLLQNIKLKVTEDGADSPVLGYLTKQEIVLADDELAGVDADLQESSRLLYSKQSMNYIQLRDLDFDPVMLRMRGEFQFLKAYVKPNFRDLGVWGATIVAPSKIVYSPNFIDRTTMFTDMVTQNATYPGTTSPLNPYLVKHTISLTDDAGKVADAIIDNTKADAATGLSELSTQNRNNLWKTPLAHLRLLCAFLMKLNNGNEKELGLYGIHVTENKKPAKLRTTKLILSAQKTLNAVLIGTVLTNTGTVDIHVYKGKTTIGAPTIVHSGEVLGITKGWSTVTVMNPSTTLGAQFTTKGSK